MDRAEFDEFSDKVRALIEACSVTPRAFAVIVIPEASDDPDAPLTQAAFGTLDGSGGHRAILAEALAMLSEQIAETLAQPPTVN